MSKELKSNIRSFRYSDCVACILESAYGRNLNEKFENLVVDCYCRLPGIQQQIAYEEGRLRKLREDYWRLSDLRCQIDSRLCSIDRLSAEIDGLVMRNDQD